MNTLPLASPVVNPAVVPNPRDSWPVWTSFAVWGLGPDDGPRPTAGPDFTPTRDQQAEALGYDLGFGGEEALPPASLDPDELAAFQAGFARGWADLDRERDACLEELAARHDAMEAMFGGPELTWPPAELAEARSHVGHQS